MCGEKVSCTASTVCTTTRPVRPLRQGAPVPYENLLLYRNLMSGTLQAPFESSLVSKVKGAIGQKNDDPRAVGMLKVTFASFEEFTSREQEDIIVHMENQKEFPTSKKFIRVFSPKRVVELASEGEDSLDRWMAALGHYLSVALGDAVYQQQTETASVQPPIPPPPKPYVVFPVIHSSLHSPCLSDRRTAHC